MLQLKKEEKLKALIDKIPEDRLFISVPEATLLFGIAKTTLYRLIRQGKIPAINLGTRLVRIDRKIMEEMFPLSQIPPEVKTRSEEHTSELQSRPHLVCRLLLEKKKKIQ